jgi:hypothetical protein
MKYILALVPLLLMTAPAQAQAQRKVRHLGMLPPVQYDKPYTGEILITRFHSEQEIRAVCKETSKLACAATANLPAGEVGTAASLASRTDDGIRDEVGATIYLR